MYHSALHNADEDSHELEEYSSNNNLVFRYDMAKGMHNKYTQCDVFYSELTWLNGFEKLLARAGKESPTFHSYMKGFSDFIEKTEAPYWMVLGERSLGYVPKPDRKLEKIKLHGYGAAVVGWRDDNEYTAEDNFGFVEELANIYHCVGDINCGYGNTGRIFKEKGKNFVMSDINGKCVYQVAKHVMGREES